MLLAWEEVFCLVVVERRSPKESLADFLSRSTMGTGLYINEFLVCFAQAVRSPPLYHHQTGKLVSRHQRRGAVSDGTMASTGNWVWQAPFPLRKTEAPSFDLEAREQS